MTDEQAEMLARTARKTEELYAALMEVPRGAPKGTEPLITILWRIVSLYRNGSLISRFMIIVLRLLFWAIPTTTIALFLLWADFAEQWRSFWGVGQ